MIKKEFKAYLWDFGGQQVQYLAHKLFLTGNSLYILLTSARQEDRNFEYWFRIISLLGENSPLICY
jgi:internalin A